MTGTGLLVILDADPSLGRRRATRAILLTSLMVSFGFLCTILLQIPIQPLVKLTLALAAMLFLLPATFQLALRAGEGRTDRSPFLWHWRSSQWRRDTRWCLRKLDQLEQKLKKQPMNAILRLSAMETALIANENSRALYHAHLLDEILLEGSAHAHVLRTTVEIMTSRQCRPDDANPVQRRLDHLYPEQRPHNIPSLWSRQKTTPGRDDKA